PIARLYRPQHVTARDLQPLVAPLLTPGTGRFSILGAASGDVETESTSNNSQPQRDSLLVFDLPDTLREIDKVAATMDVPPPQFDMEARVLALQLAPSQRNGVNLSSLGAGAPVNGFVAASGSGPKGGVTPLLSAIGLQWSRLPGDSRRFVQDLEQFGQTQL